MVSEHECSTFIEFTASNVNWCTECGALHAPDGRVIYPKLGAPLAIVQQAVLQGAEIAVAKRPHPSTGEMIEAGVSFYQENAAVFHHVLTVFEQGNITRKEALYGFSALVILTSKIAGEDPVERAYGELNCLEAVRARLDEGLE